MYSATSTSSRRLERHYPKDRTASPFWQLRQRQVPCFWVPVVRRPYRRDSYCPNNEGVKPPSDCAFRRSRTAFRDAPEQANELTQTLLPVQLQHAGHSWTLW